MVHADPQFATHEAKLPANPLAGPYGHPTHPMIVTVPIGTWGASLLFDMAARRRPRRDAEWLVKGSRKLIATGLVGAVGAAATGFLDWRQIPPRTKAKKLATVHWALNASAVLSYTANYLMRRPVDKSVPPPAYLMSLGTMAALGVSGWIGGELVYRYGVRVADEPTQATGYGEGAAAADVESSVDPYGAEEVRVVSDVDPDGRI